ncbi:hypothetical protein V8G54_009530 [Vigna mungo]|uniref:Uncharacterized protein n=1 Tax=Vigna mungo TaxID=3915 RepID=A0AAQ3S4Y8_VIGMU
MEIIKLGDENLSELNDGSVKIHISSKFLIFDFNDPIKAIIRNTYPDLMHNYCDYNFLQSRATLASIIETMNEINSYVSSLIPNMSFNLTINYVYPHQYLRLARFKIASLKERISKL